MFPKGVFEGVINQGDAKVFGRKGASVETQDIRDMELNRRGNIEEEYLGLIIVTIQSRGFREGLEDREEGVSFACCRGTHH